MSLHRSSESSLLRPRRKLMKALKRLSLHSHGMSNPHFLELLFFSYIDAALSCLVISRHASSIRRPMLPTHLPPRHRTLSRLTNQLLYKLRAAAHRFSHRKPSLRSHPILLFYLLCPMLSPLSVPVMLISELCRISLTSFTLWKPRACDGPGLGTFARG